LSSKIIEIVATRCQILKAKTLQIRFPLGLRPRPRRRNCSVPPDLLAAFKGPTSKGRKGEGEKKGGGMKGKGKEGTVRGAVPISCLMAPQT